MPASSLLSYLIYGISRLLVFGGTVLLLSKFPFCYSRVRLRRKIIGNSYLPFILLSSLAAALSVFLVYDLTVRPLTGTFLGILDLYPMSGSLDARMLFPAFLFLGLIPAVAEEFFLRGVIYSFYEPHGTAFAVFMSALATAAFAPSVRMILPLFVTGLFCGYLLHLTDSIYAACIGNFLIRFLGILMTFAASRMPVNLWQCCVAFLLCAFLLALWFALRFLRELTFKGLSPHFCASSGSFPKNLILSVANPAFLSVFLLFVLRIIANYLISILV